MNRAEEMDAIAKISPPDPVVPYVNNEVNLRGEIEREMARGPMPVVGDDKGFVVRGQRPATWGDDPRVLEKLEKAGVLKKGERLGQFISRVGLSPRQALEFSKEQIIAFVKATNAHERPPKPRMPKYVFSRELEQRRGVRR